MIEADPDGNTVMLKYCEWVTFSVSDIQGQILRNVKKYSFSVENINQVMCVLTNVNIWN